MTKKTTREAWHYMIVKECTLDGMRVLCNGEQLYTCEFEKGDLLQCALPSMMIARQLLIIASRNWKTQRKIEKMLDEDETVMFRLRIFKPLLSDKKFRRFRKYIRVVFDEYCRWAVAVWTKCKKTRSVMNCSVVLRRFKMRSPIAIARNCFAARSWNDGSTRWHTGICRRRKND